MSMMESYDTVYGPGLILAGWLLMRHYGYFDNHKKIKYPLFILLIIVISQISVFYDEQDAIYAGLTMLEYSASIILFIVIIWRDMVLEQVKLRTENKSLRINYTRIRDHLIELEEEQKPYDLKAVKISPAEERVIKTLTIYKASNREIAERLNIAEPTVKLHLYNIYNKIGVDNRFAVIDLCKYNYN
ncbi:MAG: response regulator transcription factor [Spirochaetales bacterium]|nr:response regulator transcription factor [Spirochaetales bacterium]